MAKAILTDLTRCIGCESCVYACKEINDLPKEETTKLNAKTWTVIERRGDLNVRRQCMHCIDPACASVCPVGALQKQPDGPVTYDEDRCIGCRYCILACPFEVPTYEWDSNFPRVQKCIMCSEKRVSQGKEPACTSVCPTNATIFGERDDLIRDARRRIDTNPGCYHDHIFGLEEVGGTSVLYLSNVPFEDLGFPTGLKREQYPLFTWRVLSKIPNIVMTGGVLLGGIAWVINRRIELEGQRSDDVVFIDELADQDAKKPGGQQ